MRAASHDGLTAACKQCLHERDRARYPKEAQRRAEWYKVYSSGKGKAVCAEARSRWIERSRERRAAHVILGNAVKNGRVIKPSLCQVCGASGRIEGHHGDYAKPLEVRWLCPPCHREVHRK